MLVKKSIVERWYQTDSWVYKNFAYLFENPIWSKDIPSGFSVCPYFWLSLFSLFIFRFFFVYPLVYFILPIMKFIGKPAQYADSSLRDFFTKLGWNARATGTGIVLLLISVALSLLAIFLAGFTFVKIRDFYPYLVEANRLGLYTFWVIVSLLLCFGILGLHTKFSKSECKTMNYLYVWFALFFVSLFVFIPQETFAGIGAVFKFLANMGAICGKGIYTGLKYAGLGIWWLISFRPIEAWFLPWWSYLLIFSVGAYLLDRTYQKYATQKAFFVAPENDTVSFAKNRRAWIRLFTEILNKHSYWRGCKLFEENYFATNNPKMSSCLISGHYFRLRRAYGVVSDRVYRAAFEHMWSTELAILEKQYPVVDSQLFRVLMKRDGTEEKFEGLNAALINKTGVHFNFSINKFTDEVVAACQIPEIDFVVQSLAKSYLVKEQESYKKQKVRNESWSRNMCIRVTESIAKKVGAVKNVLAFLGQETCAVFAYLWTLAKAKKQGACPYFRFVNKSDKSDVS